MIVKRFCLLGCLLCGLLVFGPGCVTKRTVSEGGSVVSENYVVKRPIRDALTASEKAH
ncbi:MAG TPA: hypothetical protein VG796_19885 [Verrucomicrobiales bacterium]|jgi:hypothetical protein|nr:hypothetical protein [Verrucomicrobiales bacterium]